VVKEIIFHSYI